MINNIKRIKNIGCFDEYSFDESLTKKFNTVNLFYGFNGAGKTTFTNLFYLFSKHCKNKQLLETEYLTDASKLEIISSKGKITEKNIAAQDLDVYIFNSKFITDHVYNGTTANIDKFSSDVKLTNESIQVLDSRINHLHQRIERINQWETLTNNKLENVWEPLKEKFSKSIVGPRLTGVKPGVDDFSIGNISELQDDLEKLFREYERKNGEQATIDELTSLKVRVMTIALRIFDMNLISASLTKRVSQTATKRIQEKINHFKEIIEEKKYQKSIDDIDKWYRVGARLLYITKDEKKECPLCHSDLTGSIQELIDEYSSHFSKELLSLIESLDVEIDRADNMIQNEAIESDFNEIDVVKNVCLKYGIVFKHFTFPEKEEVKKELKSLLTLLKSKRKNYDSEVIFSDSQFAKLRSYQETIQDFETTVIAAIDSMLDDLAKRNINSIVNEIKVKMTELSKAQYNDSSSSIFNDKKRRANGLISQRLKVVRSLLENEMSNLQISKEDELSKLNAESRYVNIYLSYLGIEHFTINTVKDKSADNLTVTYKKTGRQKTKLGNSLSEGEKTALAFSYFISKLRVEKIEDKNALLTDTIVVIDDPISSLDDNRLFQTANLIDSFFFYNEQNKAPLQLFVLSHNLAFLKYFYTAVKTNSNLKDKVNEYFISKQEPYFRKLPSGLKNFTNTYIVKLKEILDYREGKISYEDAKNYLPNYMRIVLETFLSFKMVLVNDSMNDRMPGLSNLINEVVKELNNAPDVVIDNINKDSAIKRLNHLRRISDFESHGNMAKVEDFAFISEEELKVFARYCIQVISYLDNLHYRRIRGH